MKEIFAYTSLFLSVAANVPYVIETIRGKVKPERISWLLWTVLGFTYYLSAVFDSGATWFTFGELIGPGIILALSYKFGVGGKSKLDIVSLWVAGLALTLLFVIEGTLLSLLLALFIDIIGAVLTIRKLLIDPASESKSFWGIAAVASLFALFSLSIYNLETVLFPAYVLVLSVIIFVLTDPNHEKNVAEIKKL